MTALAYAWRDRYWCAVLACEPVIKRVRGARMSTLRYRVTYADGKTRLVLPWEVRGLPGKGK